jgi:hypothetical protein
LADRIALHEARLAFERENVDLEAKTTGHLEKPLADEGRT